MKEKRKVFKDNQPMVSLTNLVQKEQVPKKRRAYFDSSNMSNPKYATFANRELRR